MTTPAPLTRDIKVLAAIFATSGVVHLVRPETYEPIMPKVVPAKREVILASGVLEIVCAAGLLHPATRRIAGWASLGVLLGVYPANFKMAGDAMQTDNQSFKAVAHRPPAAAAAPDPVCAQGGSQGLSARLGRRRVRMRNPVAPSRRPTASLAR